VSLKIRGWALVIFKVYGMEFKAWVYEWSVKVWVVTLQCKGQGFRVLLVHMVERGVKKTTEKEHV